MKLCILLTPLILGVTHAYPFQNKVNLPNIKMLEQYNKKLEQYDKKLEQFNKMLEQFNKMLEQFNKMLEQQMLEQYYKYKTTITKW